MCLDSSISINYYPKFIYTQLELTSIEDSFGAIGRIMYFITYCNGLFFFAKIAYFIIYCKLFVNVSFINFIIYDYINNGSTI